MASIRVRGIFSSHVLLTLVGVSGEHKFGKREEKPDLPALFSIVVTFVIVRVFVVMVLLLSVVLVVC